MMNIIRPGLTAHVICLIMSAPCFTMAGQCALNSGSNAVIPGSLYTDTYKLAKYADQDTLK